MNIREWMPPHGRRVRRDRQERAGGRCLAEFVEQWQEAFIPYRHGFDVKLHTGNARVLLKQPNRGRYKGLSPLFRAWKTVHIKNPANPGNDRKVFEMVKESLRLDWIHRWDASAGIAVAKVREDIFHAMAGEPISELLDSIVISKV